MCNRSVLYSLLIGDLWSYLPPHIRGYVLDNRDVPGGNCFAEFPNRQSVAAYQLARSVFKKFQDEIDQEAADKAAFSVFRAMNDRCKSWSFNSDLLGPYDEVILGEFRSAVWDFFNPCGESLFTQASIERHVDFGPGSAPGAEKETFFHKLGHSRLSASNQLIISLFDQWCLSHPSRLDAELARTLLYGSPKVEKAVKITAVPKTSTISRLVKPEPLLNMFFQKGMQKILEDRLWSYFGIDLSLQPAHNAELARYGSLTGEFSTIDLKSASDCLSLGLVKKFIDPANFRWIDLFRSPSAVIRSEDDGVEAVDLHMVATMGNAFCFPLQTAIFACAVQAVYRALGLRFSRATRNVTCLEKKVDSNGEVKQFLISKSIPSGFGVFGDDIVIKHEAYGPLVRLLGYLGFIINSDKSFDGLYEPFRESCGSDFWEGANVRGVYCKSLKTAQDRYSLINNLVAWSVRHDIPLKRAVSYLLQHVNRNLQVPPWENPDAGIRVPFTCVTSPLVKRLGKRVDGNGPDYAGSLLYRKWAARPVRDNVESDEFSRSLLGRNSAAKLLAAIKGSLRGGYLTYRVFGQVPYGSTWGIAPCWDYIPKWSDLNEIGYRWITESVGYF